MMASQLMEVDQLKALRCYVGNVERELEEHNVLKGGIELAVSALSALAQACEGSVTCVCVLMCDSFLLDTRITAARWRIGSVRVIIFSGRM